MLGLDNAATPFGLKAMQELQEINLNKEEASNPMIMFLVLNASGLTLIPVTIMVYRAQLGAVNPADVFIPIMITTFAATLAGMIAVCLKQGINIFSKAIISFILVMLGIITGTVLIFQSMPQEKNQYCLQPGSKHHSVYHYSAFYCKGIEKKNQYLRCLY